MESPLWSMGPPVLVGERILWLGSGSGVPQGGVVRWMGVLPEMGPTWTVGLELDVALPYGGIDGCWGGRRLFRCKSRHGLLVPVNSTVREKDVCSPILESPIHHGHQRDPSPSASSSFAPSPRFGTAPTSAPGVGVGAGASAPDAAALHSLKIPQDEFTKITKDCPPLPTPTVTTPAGLGPSDTSVERDDRNTSAVLQSLPSAGADHLIGKVLELANPVLAKFSPLSDRFIPKAATRRKHTPSFVQSLPLVEEETKQALYAIVDEDKEKAKPPCPPRRQKTNSSRQSRSGDYSSYCWWEGSRADVYEDVITRSTSVGHVFPPHGDNGTMSRPTKPSAYHFATTSSTSSSGRRDKANSGLFSFFRWFKRDRKSDAEVSGDDDTVYPNSLRSRGSSCGSIDTVFSTATVSSFSYVSPTAYRRQNPVSPLQRKALIKPETDSYRRRLRQRDRCRELDRNISLQKKYRLYGSDSTIQRSTDSLDETGRVSSIPEIAAETEEIQPRSKTLIKSDKKQSEVLTVRSTTSSNPFAGDGYESADEEEAEKILENTSTGRKKRKAPAPPVNCEVKYADYSLPNTLTHKTDGDSNEGAGGCASLQLPRLSHRRTSSDTTTDKKPTIHVRGKRRAPTPPTCQANDSTASRTSTALKKKRLAPQPPVTEEALVLTTEKSELGDSTSSLSTGTVIATPPLKAPFSLALSSASSATESLSLSAKALSSTPVIPPASSSVSISVSTTVVPVFSSSTSLLYTSATTTEHVPVSASADECHSQALIVPVSKKAFELKDNSKNPSSVLDPTSVPYSGPSKTSNLTAEEHGTATGSSSNERRDVSNLTPDQRQLLINNITKLQAYGVRRGSMNTPPGSPLTRHIGFPQKAGASITNNVDVIKVNAGITKHKAEGMAGTPSRTSSPAAFEPVPPISPVSPRPWYKRSSVHRESGGLGLGLKKDIFKSLEKKKDKDKHNEWMPEAGIPRSTPISHSQEHSTISKFNIFARLTEEKKKDSAEKRKSQLSILTNISALDREAAEIVQEQHARERALLAAQNDRYYATPDDTSAQNGNKTDDEAAGPPDGLRRNSAKELISLFNALSYVPARVSANAALYPKENGCPSPRNTPEKKALVMQECLKHNGLKIALYKNERIDDAVTPRSPYARRRVGSPITVTSDLEETIPSSEKVRAGPAPLAAVDDDDIDEPAGTNARFDTNAGTTTEAKERVLTPPSSTIPNTTPEETLTSTDKHFRTSIHMAVPPDSTEASASKLINGETDMPGQSFPASKSCINVATKIVNILATEEERTKDSAAKASMFWVCTRCTLENPRWRFTCDACSNWRPAERKEKTQNGEERIDNPIFVQEDVNLQVKRQHNVKKGIDWEEELKRYFPAPKKESNSSMKEVMAQRIPEISVKKNTDVNETAKENAPLAVETIQTSTSAAAALAYANPIQKAPSSTFIGGRLPQDESKVKLAKSKSEVIVGAKSSDKTPSDKPDVDEVRKARLAFFRRSGMNDFNNFEDEQHNKQSEQTDKPKPTDPYADLSAAVKGMNQTERGKLKEILKEMKNSLPKKHKQASETKAVMETQRTGAMPSTSMTDVGKHNTGAIKKQYTLANMSCDDSAKKAEAIFITRQVVYEDINIRKVDARSSKVSASCQTSSSVVRKPDQSVSFKPTIVGVHPSINVPTTKAFRRGILLPVKVENRTTEIKDGMLYTSLSKDTRRIGSGTFELIRPRDFASIEATKIGTKGASMHVYANVPHVLFPVQLAALPKDVLGPVPRELAPMVELPKSDLCEKIVTSSSSVTGSSSVFAMPAELTSERYSAGIVSPVASSSSTATSRSALLNGSSPKSVSSSSSTSNSVNTSASSSGPSNSFSGIVSVSDSAVANISVIGSSSYSVSTSSGAKSSISNSTSVSSSRPPSESGASSRSVSDSSEVERLTIQLSEAQGIADFKADFDSRAGDANTLAVNRLLRRLETTIAEGRHQEAASLARDLARLKINCCVTRQKNRLSPQTQAMITVDLYVEDKVSHQGPIPLQVSPDMTVSQLKQLVARQFEIPEHVQRWILGKQLATEDNSPLRNHLITENGCPVFLYLVAPDGDADNVEDGSSSSSSRGNTDAAGVSGQRANLGPPPAMPPDVPGRDPNRRGGWYYNYEEDRYSFCEDSDEYDDDEDERNQVDGGNVLDDIVDLPDEFTEEPPPAPPRIDSQADSERKTTEVSNISQTVQPDSLTQRNTSEPAKSPSPPAVAGTSKTPVAPARSKPPGATSAPKSHGKPPAPTAPVPAVRETSKKTESFSQTAACISAAAVSTSLEKPSTSANAALSTSLNAADAVGTEPGPSGVKLRPSAPPLENDTGTMALGWKCPVCTLVNSPTRPGCEACTTERPANYRVPTNYRSSRQEGQSQEYEVGMDEKLRNYQQLINLDRQDLVRSVEPFECSICMTAYEATEGAVLRECLHIFCRTCLIHTVQFSEEAEVKCPYRDAEYACDGVMQEREIKALVTPEMYEQHLAKSMTQAENKIGNAFHCKTPDCRGWCIFEDNVNEFRCPVCRATNCLTCQAIHFGVNCKEYQARVAEEAETNEDARRTREMLNEMVARGEAMTCPSCQVVLMKKWGCDWLRCSMCKTEICWVTRGPRWGPGGKGDTSGGCKCGVNGGKCHAKCNYCH